MTVGMIVGMVSNVVVLVIQLCGFSQNHKLNNHIFMITNS